LIIVGNVKDPEKIRAAFKKLCDANYFAGTLRFEYEDIVIAKEAALSTLRAIRNREGLENHVDLSKEKVEK
jgi:hypothetical protein